MTRMNKRKMIRQNQDKHNASTVILQQQQQSNAGHCVGGNEENVGSVRMMVLITLIGTGFNVVAVVVVLIVL